MSAHAVVSNNIPLVRGGQNSLFCPLLLIWLFVAPSHRWHLLLRPLSGEDFSKVHLVFAVKFGGRHKARLVTDGHLTPEPIENIYSAVVSLRNLRLVIFLGKLNNQDRWGADIGNVYLEAFTDETLYIVAGPELQELEGYILIFLKALYGLKSSGKRWAEVVNGILRDMKFLPSKADPCIWLRKHPI